MKRRNGFTLVELVVVIMILGILAGVAAPKFMSTSATASDNGLKQSLGVVRDAIELYAAQNAGTYPGSAGTEGGFKSDIQPFLRGTGFPKCPVAKKDSSVRVESGETALSGEDEPSTSWAYNKDTGEFICNSKENTKSDNTVRYDQL